MSEPVVNNNPENEKYEVEVTKLPFTSWSNRMRTDTVELATLVSSIFKNIFHDYIGCRIEFTGRDQNGNDYFNTNLVFRDNPAPVPDDIIKSTVNLVNRGSGDLETKEGRFNYLEMVSTFNHRSEGKIFTLTDEAKKILLEFMSNVNGKPVTMKNIDKFIELTTESANNPLISGNAEIISVIVKNVNLNAIIKKLYGDTMVISSKKNNDGNYEINCGKCQYKLEWNGFKANTNNRESIITINQYSIELAKDINIKENPALGYASRIITH